MSTVLITGGTGMIGKELTKHLSGRGYQVIILTREIPAHTDPGNNVSYALWDVDKQTIDSAAVQQADFIIHLAGAGVVDKKWTKSYKAEIRDSRIKSSALLIDTLLKNDNKARAVVSASAIGWYGEDPSRGREGFIESDEYAADFLGETCKMWEESIEPITQLGKRLVKLRLGIVLSNTGGALIEFKRPLHFGIAGILGSGKQVVSWIHIDDLCRMFIAGIENPNLSGVYNAVAPKPVTNKVLVLQLAQAMRGKFFIPLHVPSFVLKLMLGSRSIEVLKSTTVNSNKIKKTGFTFDYPNIEDAMKQLCNSK
jgi:uncharacterized protein (TIGR01777 family)